MKHGELTDQFDRTVPEDLVAVILDPGMLGDEGIRLIDSADWYEVWNQDGPTGIILVSAKEIQYLSEVSPEDVGIRLTGDGEIMHIAHILKRWNYEDGFYHA